MAKEPVLKTGARKGLQVRVLHPPPIYNFSILEACQTCLPVGRVAEWGAAVPDLSKNSNGCRIFRLK